MLSQFLYPIICTENYVQTVNFYEDHFDFIPEFELPGYVILKRKEHDNNYLAIIDKNHENIPEQYRKTATGMILNYPVKSANIAYQQFYWEGLHIVSEPRSDAGYPKSRYFYIEDPNGMLINVAEEIVDRKAVGQGQGGKRGSMNVVQG